MERTYWPLFYAEILVGYLVSILGMVLRTLKTSRSFHLNSIESQIKRRHFEVITTST